MKEDCGSFCDIVGKQKCVLIKAEAQAESIKAKNVKKSARRGDNLGRARWRDNIPLKSEA